MRRTRVPASPRAPAADRSVEVAERRARALEEPLDVRLRSSAPYPLLEVRNPIRSTQYLVMLPEHPDRASALCTCTDFARRGLGTCKHIEAAVRWMGEHPDTPPLRLPSRSRSATVWKRLDRRVNASPSSPESMGRRWRRVGAVLFEESQNR